MSGQSFLTQRVLSGASNFKLIGNDQDSHAEQNLTVFQPIVSDGFFYLGHVGVPGHVESCPNACRIVKPQNDTPGSPCLKPPTGFARVYCDAGSGTSCDFSFWQPVCNDPNYSPVGTIFFSGPGTNGSAPVVSDYPGLMLVRSDLVSLVSCVPTQIWNDHGSRASQNATLYPLPNSNYFVCWTGDYDQVPTVPYPDLKGS